MKSQILKTLLAWLCALQLAVPGPVFARQSQQPASQGQPSKLKSVSRLVQVSVIVEDKRGEPVRDLTRNDFTVIDSGQEQAIEHFSMETTERLPASPPRLPPNVFTNRYERLAAAPNSATIILFDSLNTRVQDQSWTQKEVLKFLSQVKPTDRVALYSLTTELRVLQDFTSDSSELVRALAKYGIRNTPEAEASDLSQPYNNPLSSPSSANPGQVSISDRVAQLITDMNTTAANFHAVNRVLTTLGALQDIAYHVARVPGRKNLVWVSSSFPSWLGGESLFGGSIRREVQTFTPEIEQTVRVLNSANLAVYPVDARGLVGASANNPMLDVSRNPNFEAYVSNPGGQSASLQVITPDIGRTAGFSASNDTMTNLADRTGGRAFYNSNDINVAIRNALDESRVTYELAYYPQNTVWDGKFHQIKIQVKRPDVHVRHRKGYFALADESGDPKLKLASLQLAATGPLETTSLGLSVRVDPTQASSTNWTIEILLDPREVTIEPKDNSWTTSLDVAIVQWNAKGRFLSSESKTVNLNMNREVHDQVMKEGIYLTRHAKLSSDTDRIRVLVRDNSSGLIGTVNVPVVHRN